MQSEFCPIGRVCRIFQNGHKANPFCWHGSTVRIKTFFHSSTIYKQNSTLSLINSILSKLVLIIYITINGSFSILAISNSLLALFLIIS